jgi:hypothetical protein
MASSRKPAIKKKPQSKKGKGRDSYPKDLRDAGDALREKVLREIREKGHGPLTAEDLKGMATVWPENEDLGEFLSWLRQIRREGG